LNSLRQVILPLDIDRLCHHVREVGPQSLLTDITEIDPSPSSSSSRIALSRLFSSSVPAFFFDALDPIYRRCFHVCGQSRDQLMVVQQLCVELHAGLAEELRVIVACYRTFWVPSGSVSRFATFGWMKLRSIWQSLSAPVPPSMKVLRRDVMTSGCFARHLSMRRLRSSVCADVPPRTSGILSCFSSCAG
jgi:hypothetical protein